MFTTQVIALDPGYGNTKVCLDGHVTALQSVVARSRSLGLAAIGMRMAQQAIEVEFENHHYIAGPSAWNWSDPMSSQDFTALTSPERRTLFYAALAGLLPQEETCVEWLIVGLPVPLLQDEIQAEAVMSGLKTYKGDHHFSVNGASYHLSIHRLKVLPQPVGAYADWAINEALQLRKGSAQADIAVLDLGENTLDLYAIQSGRVSPRFVGGGKVGVRRLLHLLDGGGRDLAEVDYDLRCGRLKPSRDQLESWLGEVMGVVEQTWPSLRRFTAVIPTGGGSLVLGDILRNALAAKGAAIHWPQDPINANAIGLWKWGCYGNAH